jgi:hypothetical protein
MAEPDLTMEMVAKIIFKLLHIKGKVIPMMDRTNWQLGQYNINILMPGASHKHVAFPLIFERIMAKHAIPAASLTARAYAPRSWPAL